MDSMMSVEVKQALERGFDISLATKEIRQLTISKLNAIASGQRKEEKSESSSETVDTTAVAADLKDEDMMATKVIISMNDSSKSAVPLYIVHPIEGNHTALSVFCLLSIQTSLVFLQFLFFMYSSLTNVSLVLYDLYCVDVT